MKLTRPEQSTKRLSLSPLSFDEAVTDILKIKPEPKTSKKGETKSAGPRNDQQNSQSRKKR
jgi:hypothetical protein